jgi:glycosyltransferase involved in cell wall biosynthesis
MRSGVPIVVIDEFVPVQSVPGILASCHYVVLPYRDSAQSAVVELAYQYGKPVIASDIAAFQHTVVDGKTGRLFDANSIASLAQILETVVNAHPGMYCRLRDSVRQFWALEYSLESILARYRDCIDGSVADNRRRGQSQVA